MLEAGVELGTCEEVVAGGDHQHRAVNFAVGAKEIDQRLAKVEKSLLNELDKIGLTATGKGRIVEKNSSAGFLVRII